MKNFSMTAALVLATASFAGAALAASASDTITARKANFKVMGKGMKAVSEQLKGASPDLAVIRAAAADIAGAAPKVGGFFPKGSGTEAGVKTGALPVIWQKSDEFKADAGKLTASAQGFQAAAASGDITKIKTAWMALGGSCKACHDTFKAKD
jgi:cytochrome c556